jgi:hypothetical protein
MAYDAKAPLILTVLVHSRLCVECIAQNAELQSLSLSASSSN